jgi:GNAT superfamily N-acetyltransferase
MNLTDFPVPGMVSAALLKEYGRVVDEDLVARVACDVMEAAWPGPAIEPIKSMGRVCGSVAFQPVLMRDYADEIKALHKQHWGETETHRHTQVLNPDYQRAILLEAAGRYLLVGVFQEGKLAGSYSVVLSRSMHTQGLTATEDVLYLIPELRKGRTGVRLIEFMEEVLRNLNVAELSVTVKLVNNVGDMIERMGYVPVAKQFTKQLRGSDVRT